MTLTNEERREIDRVCLKLLGFEQNTTLPDLWFGRHCSVTVGKDGPSQNEALVVPLAEALRARGWEWGHISWDSRGYRVTLNRAGLSAELDWVVDPEWYETMEEALAVAAARAVERSGEDG